MGVTSSSSDNAGEEVAQASWVVPHEGMASPWAQFSSRRYGAGIAATGVALRTTLPWLLRRRMQDWNVLGCTVRLGEDFVAFGRELQSSTGSSSVMFYGTYIRFGPHERSWLWFCPPREWMLRLHKVVLEPLPEVPEDMTAGLALPDPQSSLGPAIIGVGNAGGTGATRWPGRPHYLCDDGPSGEPPRGSSSRVTRPPAQGRIGDTLPSVASAASCSTAGCRSTEQQQPSDGSTAASSSSGETAAAPSVGAAASASACAGSAASSSAEESAADSGSQAIASSAPTPVVSREPVEHQLCMFFSNADGHVGLLCLPVPRDQLSITSTVVARWSEHHEAPLVWSGQRYSSAEDFVRLRDTAMNMPDLLLLGFEAELAMALTPDWTWEKYPRGFGEVAEREEPDVVQEETTAVVAETDTPSSKEQESS